MELISKLGIDVKLLIAQIINFLILFFVLRALIYKPVLKLLDKRKGMAEETVKDHEKIKERLQKLEEERTKVLSEASDKAMAVIETAKQEGEAERQKALANAKKEISGLAERYRAQLKSEKDQMFQEVREEVAALVVMSCEKILRKEFDKNDQKRLEGAIKDEIASVKID